MENQAKKISENKNCSRRQFLTISGTLAIGVGTGLPSLIMGCSGSGGGTADDSGSDPATAVYPASEGYLLVDLKKCQGCTTCMLACSLVHEGVESYSLSRIQIVQNSFEKWPDDIDIHHCRQCEDPACIKACPLDALTADPAYGNVRIVDKSKCVGCGKCVRACFFKPSRPMIREDREFDDSKKSLKCDLCADTPHWSRNGGPAGTQACVAICPVRAIAFTAEIPEQTEAGYYVNLRNEEAWEIMGYPTD